MGLVNIGGGDGCWEDEEERPHVRWREECVVVCESPGSMCVIVDVNHVSVNAGRRRAYCPC